MTAIIAGYARTPFVKANGQFATLPATALGAHAITAALAAAGVGTSDVDIVIGGQVLQAGAGQNPARQSAVGAGIPLTTPAITLNAVCLSGMEAVVQADRLIAAGEADVVIAVGQESMTLAPHAWIGSRGGKKFGPVELVDTMEYDGLTDAFERRSMGLSTEEFNGPFGLERAAQDEWAAASHARLAEGAEFLAGEIAPVEVPVRGGSVTVSADDGLRADTTVESLGKLRASFTEGGTITAGNASQISDGAAALVLVSAAWASAHGVTGIARVVSHAFVSGPDVSLHAQPSNAIRDALAKASVAAEDLAAVEINEAFAAVAVHSTAELGVDAAIVNSYGGAIALGHPIGASGARIVGHLARRLAAAGPGSRGAAALCGGGGQGSAVVLEAL
ncbi:MAG: acetyl-CoA C-acyltransferase [Rhodoglobus sp.]|nr:acetyl-CoA C-acyltransferase [Rhodoglobus sp.]